jgi:hypothetical protein
VEVVKSIKNVVGILQSKQVSPDFERKWIMESVYLDREKLVSLKETVVELGVSL